MISNIDNKRFINAASWKIKCPGQDHINDQRIGRNIKMETKTRAIVVTTFINVITILTILIN